MRLAETGIIELFVSRATLAELKRVLAYQEVRAISPNMTPERTSAFLKRLAYRATLVRRVRHLMDFPRDPKDEPYIDLAATANADFLITRDKDLLSLMAGHSLLHKQFRQQTHPLEVLDPVAFLIALEHLGKPPH